MKNAVLEILRANARMPIDADAASDSNSDQRVFVATDQKGR